MTRGMRSHLLKLCHEIESNAKRWNALEPAVDSYDAVSDCKSAHDSLCSQLGLMAGPILELLSPKKKR